MKKYSPADAIEEVVAARSRGDMDTVVALYQSNATIVPQPGVVLHGENALRQWLTDFAALKPAFTVVDKTIIENDDVALHLSRWSLVGTDQAGHPLEVSGRSTDVLRKQSDGSWLVAVDNPWGTGLFGQ